MYYIFIIKNGGAEMSEVFVPQGYATRLSVYETQRAIELIKKSFQKKM